VTDVATENLEAQEAWNGVLFDRFLKYRDLVIGGLAQSVNYKGNRIDIGGHRFFSKSDWVMDWWTRMLPLAASPGLDAGDREIVLAYQGRQRTLSGGPVAAMAAARSRANSISELPPKTQQWQPVSRRTRCAVAIKFSRGQRFAGPYSAPALIPSVRTRSPRVRVHPNRWQTDSTSISATASRGATGSRFAPRVAARFRYWWI